MCVREREKEGGEQGSAEWDVASEEGMQVCAIGSPFCE